MTDERNKFGKWYDENREKVASARRTRRQTDPEWAEEQRRRAREYYHRHGKKRRRKQLVPRKKSRTLPKVRVIAGREVQMVHTGDVARVVNREPKAVRSWIEEGVLPEVTYRGEENGWRMWTADQLAVIREAADATGVRRTRRANPFAQKTQDTLREFSERVHAGWKKLGKRGVAH